MLEKIEDIIKMAEQEGADIRILLLNAYSRGYRHGIDFAHDAAIEAMRRINLKHV
jgi:high-affinity nickel permease